MRAAEAILDLARWAPSGDNTQPWRFTIPSDDEVLVHGYDTRASCVYDLDGWASHLSHGALLETLSLAATRFGLRARVADVDDADERHLVYRVVLEADPQLREHELVSQIERRTVQRQPMATTALRDADREALEAAARPYQVAWLSSARDRRRMAWLSVRNAHIRLTIPEAYDVHKAVIAWHTTTSEDRLPDAALGADAALLATMRWAMRSWKRIEFMNRFAAGTVMPRLAMDFVPAIACSAHFALVAPDEPRTASARIDAGRAVQRFWLRATALGLQLQPNYTPLVFARYAREDRTFTRVAAAQQRAKEIAQRLEAVLAPRDARGAVFLGRIGPARPVKGRSLRLPLRRLVVDAAPDRLG
jgi:nitroreductase